MNAILAEAIARAGAVIHFAVCEENPGFCIAGKSHERIAREALEAAAQRIDAADLPAIDGEPLTHFFHCWRFPAHQACAVALIERLAAENDALWVWADTAEREARQAATAERGLLAEAQEGGQS